MTGVVLGIDVSKKTLDTSIRVGGKLRCRRFINSPDGWRQLIRWLTEHEVRRFHACQEVTGRYSLGIALALHQTDHVVSIVNSARIRDFVRIKLGRLAVGDNGQAVAHGPLDITLDRGAEEVRAGPH